MCYTQEAEGFLFLFDDTNAETEQTAAKQEHQTDKNEDASSTEVQTPGTVGLLIGMLLNSADVKLVEYLIVIMKAWEQGLQSLT